MTRRLLRGFGIFLIALPEPFTTMLGVTLLFASYSQFGKQKVDSDERLQSLLGNWGEYYKPIGYIMLTRQTAPVRVPRTANRSLPYRRTVVMEALKLTDNLESRGRRWRDSEGRRSLLVLDMSSRRRREVAGIVSGNAIPEKWPWGGEQRGRQQPGRLCAGEESRLAGTSRRVGEGSESLSGAALLRARQGLPGLLERRRCPAVAVC
ncbi:MAG: hypothetical protein Q8P00_00845 [Dehalococcoidia bacterium]|nr:hypothetical protein [Dehalococcoidia bacterium]